MSQKVDIQMPPDLDLADGWTLRVNAVDSSGATVSGVAVSNMAITTPDLAGDGGAGLQVGPFMLVPGPEA